MVFRQSSCYTFATMNVVGNKKRGALPAQAIKELVEARCIEGAHIDNIRPASLDLSLSDEIYAVSGIFQPLLTETVREVLTHIFKRKHPLNAPLVPGTMYLARLNERLALPQSVYGYCNPKSTTGRNDVHVRVLADRVPRYDAVTPGGFKGELWLAISPKSYAVKLAHGVSLSQLRLFTADTRFDEVDLEIAMKRYKLLWHPDGAACSYKDIAVRDHDGSIILTLDTETPVVGYECIAKPETLLDFGKVGGHKASGFFRPVKNKDGFVTLKREHFYILSSHEAVRVPPDIACEMVPMDERSGEFRSHYAGFIDPGWGWGRSGEGKGRQLTLEVRPFEDLIIRRGQPIAKIRFERMTEVPEITYDALGTSNYAVQRGARLAKQFAI